MSDEGVLESVLAGAAAGNVDEWLSVLREVVRLRGGEPFLRRILTCGVALDEACLRCVRVCVDARGTAGVSEGESQTLVSAMLSGGSQREGDCSGGSGVAAAAIASRVRAAVHLHLVTPRAAAAGIALMQGWPSYYPLLPAVAALSCLARPSLPYEAYLEELTMR